MTAATVATHPAWCSDHTDTVHFRNRYGPASGPDPDAQWRLSIGQGEDEPALIDAWLWQSHGLNPEQARAMAAALVELADTLEGHDSQRETLRRNVGASVAAAMAERGVTVEQLAPAIGRPEGHVWRRLAGASSFSVDDLVSIAHVLEVDPGTLIA